ncbi:MAG: symmetrical bis(5'-nucleosyl)-tetraphosphatase [Chromatiales bacterium]|nr:symmetrical bis(5'-nucleosyl)-tetraphosphatase [Chromatiales bacterium]
MAVYAIGDIQGCYDDFRRLLDKIGFTPEKDKIWIAGDLVNRGPRSLEVLRYVKSLGERAISVLGNHDLHLLAVAAGNNRHMGKDHTLDAILAAPDRDELIEWLRHRPLLYHSKKRGYTLIHAGLPPQWDIPQACKLAKEVEGVLRSSEYTELLHNMYGNQPSCWSESLTGIDRLRFIINALTRLRYCDTDGNMALREKGPIGSQAAPFIPWYSVPGRRSQTDRVIFGHWSTLGYQVSHNTWSLDSGCLWGGQLTAIKVRKRKTPKPIQIDCPGVRKPRLTK